MRFSNGAGLAGSLLTFWLTVQTAAWPIRHHPHDSQPLFDISWKPCTLSNFPSLDRILSNTSIAELSNVTGLDCGEMKVPINWADCSGEETAIRMMRLNATSQEKRLGNLIYNPGGPGGAASRTIAGQAIGHPFFSEGLHEQYDIIGPDPRGVGMSTPVQCDPDAYNLRVTPFPRTEEEFQALVARNRAFGESCRERTGTLFYHLDTTSVARDMDALREALGDEKLNWFGTSYGTQIGGQYAELFPLRVGRMVLDGIVDHSQSETSALHAEASTYEDTLNQFFLWCNATSTTEEECPFKGEDLPHMFDTLIAEANEKPIPAPECSKSGMCREDVYGDEALFNIQPMLVSTARRPMLADSLKEAMEGNASSLSMSLATSSSDAQFPSFAVGCLDWPHNSRRLADLVYRQQVGRIVAPHTHGATQSYGYDSNCIGWPAPLQDPPHYLNARAMSRAPPIVLVNAFHDPETSYVWAQGVLDQTPSGVLLARNGSGHSSYFLQGEVAAAMDSFMLNGTLPAPNTVLQT